VQLHIHAVEFDYLCQSIESATVMLGNPGRAQLLVDSLVMDPQKWLRSGHFLARHNLLRRRGKSGAPVVSDSSSAYEESDTYWGNCRIGGGITERDKKVRTTLHSEVSVRGSYFGVRVSTEQSHEAVGVVAASWRRTRICNCLRPIA